MLGDNPTLLPTVSVCSYDYDTVVIMFYCLCFSKVPSKAFGIMLGDSWFDLAEKLKLLCSGKQFSFLIEAWQNVDSLCGILTEKLPRFSYFSEFLV